MSLNMMEMQLKWLTHSSTLEYTFTHTFSETKVHLSEQATKAVSLLKKWRQFDIPVDLMLESFDKSADLRA